MSLACAHAPSSHLHLCTFCSSVLKGGKLTLSSGSPTTFFTHTQIVIECHLILYWKNNFQQRISWLSHRWRTQRNAISNVNCRIQWIIESLNASCALWYSGEHACLSVMNLSNTKLYCFCVWTWKLVGASRLFLNALAGVYIVDPWCDNYLRLEVPVDLASNRLVMRQFWIIWPQIR